jgi:hypothetical protein
MMHHLWNAILITSLVAVYVAFMWITLAFARHAHDRIRIMLATGYYWRDAGAILRREARQKYGPRPGRHRPNPRAVAELLSSDEAPWPPPELPPGDLLPTMVPGLGTEPIPAGRHHATGPMPAMAMSPGQQAGYWTARPGPGSDAARAAAGQPPPTQPLELAHER